MPDALSRTTRTARKPHHCDACSPFKIQPGMRYMDERYAYDGRAYTLRICLECSELTNLVWQYANELDGITDDDYFDWATENKTDPTYGPQARAYLTRVRGTSEEA